MPYSTACANKRAASRFAKVGYRGFQFAMNAQASSPQSDSIAHLKNPWLVIPLLYFMQAMPVFIVQQVSLLVYKDLGIDNLLITRWTSLIALPWSMQFLLGPLVEFNGTKRMWILGGQALISLGLVIAAFTLGLPNAFNTSLAVLGVTAITSALCNIATDGFYIISQTKEGQTKFAGIQTTFFRLGRLFCMWLLVKVAGVLIEKNGFEPGKAWSTVLIAAAVVYLVGFLVNLKMVPKLAIDQAKAQTEPDQNRRNLFRTLLITFAGLATYFLLNSVTRLIAHAAASIMDPSPTGPWKGWLLAFPENKIKEGAIERVVQMPVRWGPIDSPFNPVMSEVVQALVCFGILAVTIVTLRKTLRGSEMSTALSTFFKQEGIVAILFFVLFYRLPEAMLGGLSALFFKDPIAKGGLGITTEQVGDIKGLFSVFGIIVGGLIGGWVVHKLGLKRAFLPVALAMHLPNVLYLYASMHNASIPPLPPLTNILQFSSHPLVVIEFFDQMGYGIGYAAYFVYLMQVAQRGSYITAHYAIASGLGALCIAMAGIIGGIVQSNYQWVGFFWAVIIATIPGLIALYLVPWNSQTNEATA